MNIGSAQHRTNSESRIIATQTDTFLWSVWEDPKIYKKKILTNQDRRNFLTRFFKGSAVFAAYPWLNNYAKDFTEIFEGDDSLSLIHI